MKGVSRTYFVKSELDSNLQGRIISDEQYSMALKTAREKGVDDCGYSIRFLVGGVRVNFSPQESVSLLGEKEIDMAYVSTLLGLEKKAGSDL